jgi:hypothetical protein
MTPGKYRYNWANSQVLLTLKKDGTYESDHCKSIYAGHWFWVPKDRVLIFHEHRISPWPSDGSPTVYELFFTDITYTDAKAESNKHVIKARVTDFRKVNE